MMRAKKWVAFSVALALAGSHAPAWAGAARNLPKASAAPQTGQGAGAAPAVPELVPASLFNSRASMAPEAAPSAQIPTLSAPLIEASAAFQPETAAPSDAASPEDSALSTIEQTAQAINQDAARPERNAGRLDRLYHETAEDDEPQAPAISTLTPDHAAEADRKFKSALKIIKKSRMFVEHGNDARLGRALAYAGSYVQANPYVPAVEKLVKNAKLRKHIHAIGHLNGAQRLAASLDTLIDRPAAAQRARAMMVRTIFIAAESALLAMTAAGIWLASMGGGNGFILAGLLPLFIGNIGLVAGHGDDLFKKMKIGAQTKNDFAAYAKKAAFFNKSPDSLMKAYRKLHASELSKQKRMAKLWSKFSTKTGQSYHQLSADDSLEEGMSKLLHSPNQAAKDQARRIFSQMIMLEALQAARSTAIDRASRTAKYLWIVLNALPPQRRPAAYQYMTQALGEVLQEGQVIAHQTFMEEVDAFMTGWEEVYEGEGKMDAAVLRDAEPAPTAAEPVMAPIDQAPLDDAGPLPLTARKILAWKIELSGAILREDL